MTRCLQRTFPTMPNPSPNTFTVPTVPTLHPQHMPSKTHKYQCNIRLLEEWTINSVIWVSTLVDNTATPQRMAWPNQVLCKTMHSVQLKDETNHPLTTLKRISSRLVGAISYMQPRSNDEKLTKKWVIVLIVLCIVKSRTNHEHRYVARMECNLGQSDHFYVTIHPLFPDMRWTNGISEIMPGERSAVATDQTMIATLRKDMHQIYKQYQNVTSIGTSM